MKISKLFIIDLKFLFVFLFLSFLFFSTRFYKISSIPQSVYWDEASIGYNAYSVANTLKDEWGEFLPLHFRAFGEFKLPVYIYSVAVFTKLLGLNALSVRIPTVLFSYITIVFLGLSVFELLKNKWISLLAMFFLTISPWFFLFSRTGYEATSGLAFFTLSFYLFLLSLKKASFFLMSVISLIITLYCYNSFRIISPIALAIYTLVFFISNKESMKLKLTLFVAGLLISIACLFPIYKLITQDFGLSRFSAVRAESIRDIFNNLLVHFSPKFLFKGDTNPRSQIPGFGEIWYLDVPLFLLGIFYLIKQKKLVYFVPLFLFLISFVPAALTKESPHALRSLNAVIFFYLTSVFGIRYLLDKSKNMGVLVVSAVVLVNTFFYVNYFRVFLNNYPSQSSESWQYGYKQIFEDYSGQIQKARKVIISDKYAQPYIFALFYQKIDPLSWRDSVKYNPVDKWGISTVASFGKFEFRKPIEEDLKNENLIFASSAEIETNIKPMGTIKFLDKSPALFVYQK